MIFFIILLALITSYQHSLLCYGNKNEPKKKSEQAQSGKKSAKKSSTNTIVSTKKNPKACAKPKPQAQPVTISKEESKPTISKPGELLTVPAPKKREITIINHITRDMTAKRYLGFDYYPDSFSICINKEQLKDNEERKIAIQDNKLLIEYNYNFRNGYRKGTRIVEFEVPEAHQQCTLTFSWEQNSHVLIDNANFISLKDV